MAFRIPWVRRGRRAPSEAQQILQATLEAACASSTLPDLEKAEKAASIAKFIAEAQKSAAEAKIHRPLAFYLTLFAKMAPLIAIVVAIFQLLSQSEANRQQNEDTQWRDLLSSLRGTSPYESDLTVPPRLKSFFESSRYREQAKDNVRFSNVALKDAVLTPSKYDNIIFIGTQWWEVKAIDQGLLNQLVKTAYPYKYPWESFNTLPPTMDRYYDRIRNLCNPISEQCEERNLVFGASQSVRLPESAQNDCK